MTETPPSEIQPPETISLENGFNQIKNRFATWVLELIDSPEKRSQAAEDLAAFDPKRQLHQLKEAFEQSSDPYKNTGDILKQLGISGIQLGLVMSIYALSEDSAEIVSKLLAHWVTVDEGILQIARIGATLQLTDMCREVAVATLNGESPFSQRNKGPNMLQYSMFLLKQKLTPNITSK